MLVACFITEYGIDQKKATFAKEFLFMMWSSISLPQLLMSETHIYRNFLCLSPVIIPVVTTNMRKLILMCSIVTIGLSCLSILYQINTVMTMMGSIIQAFRLPGKTLQIHHISRELIRSWDSSCVSISLHGLQAPLII